MDSRVVWVLWVVVLMAVGCIEELVLSIADERREQEALSRSSDALRYNEKSIIKEGKNSLFRVVRRGVYMVCAFLFVGSLGIGLLCCILEWIGVV